MERQPLPFNRAVFEANAYSPAMRRFFYAARENVPKSKPESTSGDLFLK
jgi:hypothetical protein